MGTGPKRVLLVDAVNWSDAYPQNHPLRNVHHWFQRHLSREATLGAIPAEEFPNLPNEEGFDGVIISGSPRDAYLDDEFTLNLMKRLEKVEKPMLGVCYGHQIIARTLGAKVAKDPAGLELGNSEIELTEYGKNAPIFAGFPDNFDALQSHADAVLELPAGAKLLAKGKHTAVQGFQFGDAIFGVQFHPETDPDVLRFLWEPRKKVWGHKAGFDVDERLRSMQPSPTSAKVLHNFVNNL